MKKNFSKELRDVLNTNPFDRQWAWRLTMELHKFEDDGGTLTLITERLWLDLTDKLEQAEKGS